MKRVLIIEDDKNIAELVAIHIRDMDCVVDIEFNGNTGFLKAMENGYDLIILDLMLPGMDGMDICRQLRAEKCNTPILMLTAKSDEIDKILGLETGADDYLTKPFNIRELTARVKAIFRRTNLLQSQSPKNENIKLSFEPLFIDVGKRIVTLNNERVELTPKEFDLLVLLATHPGSTYSRSRILNLVWGYEFEGYDHTVNSHINRLRAKIEPDLTKPKYILTTWGVGYRFSDQV